MELFFDVNAFRKALPHFETKTYSEVPREILQLHGMGFIGHAIFATPMETIQVHVLGVNIQAETTRLQEVVNDDTIERCKVSRVYVESSLLLMLMSFICSER